jgi:citrate synthase
MDILPPGFFGIATPAGLLLVAVWLLMTGRLVSGRTLDRLQDQWNAEKSALTKQWDDRLDEAHQRERDWKAAHATSEEIRANVAAQMDRLSVNSEAAARVITALPVVSAARSADGD